MRKFGGRQAWRQRIIALVAAYAVALSSLVASFGAAQAAAEAAANPLGVICHNTLAGQSDPLTGQRNSNTCIDCCCVGCLMPMAALPPPPPAHIAPRLAAISHRVVPAATAALLDARTAKSHRSRAPPA